MLIIEGKRGLPLAEGLFAGNVQEKTATEPTLNCGLRGIHKPDNMLGDANFSSEPLSQKLWRKFRVHLTAPPKRHYVHLFHDARRLRRIRRRWKIERCFGWLKSHRRIDVRWDVKAEHYLGFIQLCSCMILLKNLF
jgi:transposase